MENEYLGEVDVTNSDENPYKHFTKRDWMMYFLEHYGQYDGGHHKQWVLDQMARINYGCKVIVKKATWTNHKPEFRCSIQKVTKRYNQWVREMCDGEDGPHTYSYDKGIAP